MVGVNFGSGLFVRRLPPEKSGGLSFKGLEKKKDCHFLSVYFLVKYFLLVVVLLFSSPVSLVLRSVCLTKLLQLAKIARFLVFLLHLHTVARSISRSTVGHVRVAPAARPPLAWFGMFIGRFRAPKAL